MLTTTVNCTPGELRSPLYSFSSSFHAGALVGELVDPNLSTICPVNKPHPRLDLIGGRAGGTGVCMGFA